jgi:hypothetical protein
VTYRGEPCAVTLSLALVNSGELQIELIHQTDDTPSIFTEFLNSGASGATGNVPARASINWPTGQLISRPT